MTVPTTPRAVWLARAAAHQQRVGDWADRYLQRRSYGEKHPVEDFLFTYYNFSPNKLKRWLPGLGEVLEVDAAALSAYPELSGKECVLGNSVVQLDAGQMPAAVRRAAEFILQLCTQILDRAPRFRCYGMHEWAMVYRQSAEQVRHQGYDLRLSAGELAQFVEQQPIVCSHYDAFRFFTEDARPLNTLQPTLETRLQMEQGACLHANMDLYKWAYKLWPWCGSDLVGEAFSLARRGREMDMRASPYDLAHLGYKPIRIETAEGREEYEQEQRALATAAVPVRESLRAAAQQVLHTAGV
jgi:hypothetical protein